MNPFRHLLKARGARSPIGTWVSSASPLVAEALGHAGFDWGVVDMEHAPADLMEVVHQLQAIGNTKMVPVVRVPWNDAVTVKRVLDAGAQTVLFPFVQDATEAASAAPDYLRQANKGIAVIVQLETPAALAQLEAIAAVPGVDALFVGPADLSASMGHVGHFTHPSVMALMTDAARRAKALGMPIGTLGATAEAATRYRAMGYDFMAVGTDLGLLMQGAQSAIRALRAADDDAGHVHTLSEGTRTAGS
jgi:2-keto-3-deoxy-L-rhamnonate aldolase RhmA